MAEYIKVPAGVYDMVTRCMEQEFPDHVAIRYVAEDGKIIKQADGLVVGDELITCFADGEVRSKVLKK